MGDATSKGIWNRFMPGFLARVPAMRKRDAWLERDGSWLCQWAEQACLPFPGMSSPGSRAEWESSDNNTKFLWCWGPDRRGTEPLCRGDALTHEASPRRLNSKAHSVLFERHQQVLAWGYYWHVQSRRLSMPTPIFRRNGCLCLSAFPYMRSGRKSKGPAVETTDNFSSAGR